MNSTFFDITSADDLVPMNNLVVEYLFNSWSSIKDTSGNNYPAILVGDASFEAESWSNISYANFPWSGQFWWVFWWQADTNVPFTLSFGIKTGSGDRVNTSNIAYGCPTTSAWTYYSAWTPYDATQCTANWSTSRLYTPYVVLPASNNPQYIFTTKKPTGGFASDFWVKLRNDYKCEFESGGEFDCSFLQNWGWHSIIFRRNYFKKLELFVDGVRTNFWDNNGFTTGKLISLAKPTVYGTGTSSINNESYKFRGNLSAFRLYNTDVSDSQISALASEFAQFIPVDSTIPVITLNQPDLLQSTTKKISAQTSTWVLQMIQTNWLLCNNTLWTFDDYIDLTFTSIDDNGKRVCYRSTNGSKQTFKLSDKIGGIIGTSSSVVVDPIFGDATYRAWSYSLQPKIGDYTRSILSGVSGVNFIDMNGDGLIDIIYNKDYFLGIFVNNGDYTFRPAYKCKQTYSWYPGVSNFAITGYYWDCADVNYK